MNEFYKENGYLVKEIPGLASTVSWIRMEIVELFGKQIFNNVPDNRITPHFESNLIELFKINPTAYINTAKAAQNLINVYRLMVNEQILDIVGGDCDIEFPTVCTKPVLLLNNKNTAKDEVNYKTPPHQDQGSIGGSLNSVVVWVPMCNVDSRLGPLEVIPGSHKLGAKWNYYYDDKGFARVDETEGFIPLEMKLGEVVVFSQMLIHRSGTNIEENKMRWSLSFRYNDANCTNWQARDYHDNYIYKPKDISQYRPSPQDMEKVFS